MALDLDKLFPRHFELKDDKELTFFQSEVGDVGCVVWDAALVLSSYLLKQEQKLCNKTVLELGAGTGAVGLVAASCGAKSVITDLPQFVPLMQHNIKENKARLQGSCSAAELTWGNKEQMERLKENSFPSGVDYILVADCVYYEESVEALVETILHFSTLSTTVYVSYEERDLGNKEQLQLHFFKIMGEHFHISEIPTSSQDPHFSSPDIHLMKLSLKGS